MNRKFEDYVTHLENKQDDDAEQIMRLRKWALKAAASNRKMRASYIEIQSIIDMGYVERRVSRRAYESMNKVITDALATPPVDDDDMESTELVNSPEPPQEPNDDDEAPNEFHIDEDDKENIEPSYQQEQRPEGSGQADYIGTDAEIAEFLEPLGSPPSF